MTIPLKYNIRNLVVRWRSTLTTMLGIALVVAVFVMVMALARGLQATYINTGDARNLLVLRKGSTAESSSQIERAKVRMFKYRDEIARDAGGEPMLSAEIIVLILLDRMDGGTANVIVRGIGSQGLALRPTIRLVEGRMFRPGVHECVVSRRIADRFKKCRLGESFHAGKADWTVVGIFDAQRTAYDSEVWTDADEARDAFNRSFYGSALLRPASAQAGEALTQTLEADKQLYVRVLSETKYYDEQTKNAGPIRFMGMFLATVMSIGAAFAAMNTMYAAVGARTSEIGTLRVLGFRRRQIYGSFLLESVVLALAGGMLGCLASLPLNGLATGTMSWTTFSEVTFQFQITSDLLAQGMAFALVMGVLGGLLPARMAASKPVLDAIHAA